MNELTDANEEAFLDACGALDVDPGSYDRRELKAVAGGKTISNPTTSIDIDRDIGNFVYDLKPTRDAGVGLTEQTIDYIVDVKGEPDWIREFRKNAYRASLLAKRQSGVGTTFPRKLNKRSSALVFLRANGSFSPESKLSLIARRSIRTSKRRCRIRV